MDKKNKISLVIRTLNEEANIRRCLDAVYSQKRVPDEILIVDNQSVDKTRDIAQSYERRDIPLKVIDNPIIGFSSGLNLGLACSSYKYVCFLSADCFPEIDWLFELEKTIYETGSAVVEGMQIPYPMNDIHYVLSYNRKLLPKAQKVIFFSNTNTLYDKEILKKYLPFCDFGKSGGEDSEMSIKFYRDGVLAFITPNARVEHNLFNNIDEFKDRVFKHATKMISMFLVYPGYPRLYLNSFYWSAREILWWFSTRDSRFLKIGLIRLTYTFKGIFVFK